MNGGLIFGACLGLASCSPAVTPPPLNGATIGGPFSLIDQAGRHVTNRDFAGRYRIMYFGYTSCPDVCPTDLQVIGAAMRSVAKEAPATAKRIVPVFVTIDPARDTPAVLKTYVAAFGPEMVGLTGSAEEISRVAKEYRVYYKAAQPDPSGEYIVQHTDQALLFGPDGKPIVVLPIANGAAAVATTLEKWVQ